MNRNIVPMVVCLTLLYSTKMFAQQPQARLLQNVQIDRDLEYVKNGHERHRLDIYRRKNVDQPQPLVVWIHGGAWLAGSKASGRRMLQFLKHDYAVASINYRLSHHAIFPAQIEDCKAAIRYLRANAKKFNIDPNRIGVAGASAGGHLVALLGTSGDAKELEGDGGNAEQSSHVQAVVDLFGPTDLTQMGGSHDNPNSPEAKLIGGPVQEKKAEAAKANPINYITKDDPPFQILHGDKDRVVPHSQSELLTAALKKAGVPVTFHTLAGAGHGGRQFESPETFQRILEFFDQHLKK
ncbi:alpha/beta hydrolase [Thalassoroseus pseudoceratinae]|uniref:alpha/beta hydrolase n=1 Tax=Thalassoroseus pseudoceratinae TaxID=2713176 RepID=UPI00198209B9|nr:alpha/beta hydrolase [Thalassoroseus pseudoceratinae]